MGVPISVEMLIVRVAGIALLVVVVGMIVISSLGKPIPSELPVIAGSALTGLFAVVTPNQKNNAAPGTTTVDTVVSTQSATDNSETPK